LTNYTKPFDQLHEAFYPITRSLYKSTNYNIKKTTLLLCQNIAFSRGSKAEKQHLWIFEWAKGDKAKGEKAKRRGAIERLSD
jgi:hypothetical protein